MYRRNSLAFSLPFLLRPTSLPLFLESSLNHAFRFGTSQIKRLSHQLSLVQRKKTFLLHARNALLPVFAHGFP
jgi:hypothetical protein